MPDLFRQQCYIDGEWISADSAATLEVVNPATGDVLGVVPDCAGAETQRAIAAADRALPAWRKLSAKDRCAYLSRLYDLMAANADELGNLLTREQGKPIAQGRGEVMYGAKYVKFYAELRQSTRPETIDSGEITRRVYREPIGVCAAITPWNFPNAMIARSMAPALATGCTIICKPAPETPFSALALAALADEAGIPPGVFNVVTGDAVPIAAELMNSPIVRKMSFTGSTEVGRILIRQSAETITKMTLEMGGNAPFVVFADADLDVAVANAVACKFRNAGQTCICANRFLVEDSIVPAFIKKFSEYAAASVVGDGLNEETTIGPLISQEAVDKVLRLVADAVDKDAVVAHGKQGAVDGLFVSPLVLSGVTAEMQIFHEEIFGPVASIISFSDEAEAIAMANNTDYGLAAYVMSGDQQRAKRMRMALQFGMVGINTGLIAAVQAPFGGVKQSGYGREGSRHGLEEYTVLKYVCADKPARTVAPKRGKKQGSSTKKPSVVLPEVPDQWMLHKGIWSNALPILVRVRHGLEEQIGSPIYPNRYMVTWTFQEARKDGFPTKKETGVLKAFEDAIFEPLEDEQHSILVAVITNNGERDWIFYTRKIDEAHRRLNEAVTNARECPIKVVAFPDPSWEEYRGIVHTIKTMTKTKGSESETADDAD